MKNDHWIIIILFLVFVTHNMWGQQAMLEKKVTIQYFDVKLEDALDDISKDYDVNFSYSIDRVEVNQKVTVDVKNTPLKIALTDMLEETDITYAGIGDQVVLKTDFKKRKLLSERKPQPEPKIEPVPKKEIIQPVIKSYVVQPRLISSINMRKKRIGAKPDELFDTPEMVGLDYVMEMEEEDQIELEVVIEEYFKPLKRKGAQVTFFGQLGTNFDNNGSTTNAISANILWGRNGGVNGTEVGGLVNSVVRDVNGIQVAGLGNTVGGDMNGTQVGGLFNVNRGATRGIQASGLVNVGGDVKGVQATGLVNVAGKGSTGIQASGIGNVAGRASKGGIQASGIFNVNLGNSNVQVAGLFNHNRGRNNMQVAGLYNVSRKSTNIQVAGLLNVAKRVNGCQIGLINVADTVGGASIGLINIVKRGYNRLEFSGADVLYFNAELKLGSRRFYNIFHVGFRPINDQDGHYAFGYGFGKVFGKRWKMINHNVEILATQIRDVDRPDEIVNGIITKHSQKLNLLTQFRYSIDCKLKRRMSVFVGPTFNVMFSRLVDPATGEYNLDILPKPLFEEKEIGVTDPMYIAGWIGFNAGIRF